MNIIYKTFRLDWNEVYRRNKGSFIVEHTPEIEKGYFIKYKYDSVKRIIPATKTDIECLIENSLCALDSNVGPIVVPNNEEENKLLIEGYRLIQHLLNNLNDNDRWFLRLMWTLFENVKVNERAKSIII